MLPGPFRASSRRWAGAWVMVEADRVRGRTLTSWPSLKTDIRNVAGNWVDAEVRSKPTGRTPW